MVVKGEVSEERAMSYELPPPTWQELIALIERLARIASELGRTGCCIFLDEANALTQSAPSQIMSMIDTIGNAGVAVCLIGVPHGALGDVASQHTNAGTVAVGPFLNHTPVSELLDRCNKVLGDKGLETLTWDREFLVLLHALSRGEPYQVQDLLGECVREMPEDRNDLSARVLASVAERQIKHWIAEDMYKSEWRRSMMG